MWVCMCFKISFVIFFCLFFVKWDVIMLFLICFNIGWGKCKVCIIRFVVLFYVLLVLWLKYKVVLLKWLVVYCVIFNRVCRFLMVFLR